MCNKNKICQLMLYTAVFARFYRSGLLLVAYGNSWCNEIGKNLCTQPYITLTHIFCVCIVQYLVCPKLCNALTEYKFTFVCVCVSVTLSVNSPTGQTPQRIFTVDSLKDADLCKVSMMNNHI